MFCINAIWYFMQIFWADWCFIKRIMCHWISPCNLIRMECPVVWNCDIIWNERSNSMWRHICIFTTIWISLCRWSLYWHFQKHVSFNSFFMIGYCAEFWDWRPVDTCFCEIFMLWYWIIVEHGKTRNENYFKNRIFLKLLPIQKIKQHDSFEIFTLIFTSSLIAT